MRLPENTEREYVIICMLAMKNAYNLRLVTIYGHAKSRPECNLYKTC